MFPSLGCGEWLLAVQQHHFHMQLSRAAVCGLPSSSAGFQQKLKVLMHEPSLPFPTKRPNRMKQDAPKPKQTLKQIQDQLLGLKRDHFYVSPQKPDEYIYQTVDQTEA